MPTNEHTDHGRTGQHPDDDGAGVGTDGSLRDTHEEPEDDGAGVGTDGSLGKAPHSDEDPAD